MHAVMCSLVIAVVRIVQSANSVRIVFLMRSSVSRSTVAVPHPEQGSWSHRTGPGPGIPAEWENVVYEVTMMAKYLLWSYYECDALRFTSKTPD